MPCHLSSTVTLLPVVPPSLSEYQIFASANVDIARSFVPMWSPLAASCSYLLGFTALGFDAVEPKAHWPVSLRVFFDCG